jgi:hypothetical protein
MKRMLEAEKAELHSDEVVMSQSFDSFSTAWL